MANFDADTLGELRDVQEVCIRTEKHPKNAVVIWVAVADDEVFVRSWLGARGRWYRDLAAGGPATLEFADRRLAVQAIPASDPDCGRPNHQRNPEEYRSQQPCAGDGARGNPADHDAARTALTAELKTEACDLEGSPMIVMSDQQGKERPKRITQAATSRSCCRRRQDHAQTHDRRHRWAHRAGSGSTCRRRVRQY